MLQEFFLRLHNKLLHQILASPSRMIGQPAAMPNATFPSLPSIGIKRVLWMYGITAVVCILLNLKLVPSIPPVGEFLLVLALGPVGLGFWTLAIPCMVAMALGLLFNRRSVAAIFGCAGLAIWLFIGSLAFE